MCSSDRSTRCVRGLQTLLLTLALCAGATSAYALRCAPPDLSGALSRHAAKPGAEVLVGTLRRVQRGSRGGYIFTVESGAASGQSVGTSTIALPSTGRRAAMIAGAPSQEAIVARMIEEGGVRRIFLITREEDGTAKLQLGPCPSQTVLLASRENMRILRRCDLDICQSR